MAGAIRIGISGWRYDAWRDGAFYPKGLPRHRELAYASRCFPSAEINGSFYGLLRPSTWERYREDTPQGFVFAVKGSRFITHAKKLTDARTPLANFFASGLLRLEDRLGPLLWQLPAMQWEVARVERFFELLPKDTQEASKLARRHDARLTGRASMAVHRSRRLRHALEIRHPAFFCEELVRACRRHGVALAFSHGGGEWPYTEELTAGFVYLRLHGAPKTYASPYGEEALDRWAGRIRTWAGGREPGDAARITRRAPPRRRGRDVYAYFDNDQHAHAPRDARSLMACLGVEAPGGWDAAEQRPADVA